jgi:hypothetical protein
VPDMAEPTEEDLKLLCDVIDKKVHFLIEKVVKK